MVFGINLPDWKNILQEILTSNVKVPLETKVSDIQNNLEQKFKEFKENNKKFQKTVIAVLFASFLVLTITLTFKENEPSNNQTQT